jgi:oligopeptide transport system substrate-binding protein
VVTEVFQTSHFKTEDAYTVTTNHAIPPRVRALACLFLLLLFCLMAPPLRGAPPVTFRRTIERVTSLDPAEAASVYAARSVSLIYETLLEYNYEARPYRLIPGLAAELPQISPDGLTYTFRLAPGARFHADPCFGTGPGGEPLSREITAADFVFSLKRLADAKLASPGYWILDGRIVGLDAFREASRGDTPTDYSLDVAGLAASDDHTLQLRLTRPCPPFIWMLAMPYTAVVPPEAVAAYGRGLGDHPVGSGPYRLGEWRRNYRMVFERVPAWRGWRAGPAALRPDDPLRPYDRLLFPIMDDPSTQWLSFLAGELDLQGEIARDSWELVVDPQGKLRPSVAARGIVLSSMPTLEVAYIGINMEFPLLGTNRWLRQALNCAFDSARWEQYYQGRVLAANGPVPPGVAGRLETPAPYAFDLDRARRLMVQAGYPGGRDPATGRRLRLVMDMGRASQDVRESTELIVAFMSRIGIDLVPEYHNWPAFLAKVAQRRSQLFRIGWVGDYPDAENFLQLFYGPNQSPGPNRCNYQNPAYDALYRRALAATTTQERLRLYGELQEIIREECPWIFVSFARAYSLHHRHVIGYCPHDFPYGMEKYLRWEAGDRGQETGDRGQVSGSRQWQ